MLILFLAFLAIILLVLSRRNKKLIGISIVLFLPLASASLLYFLLNGNPILDLFSKRLSVNGQNTLYYKFGNKIFYRKQGNITTDRRYLDGVDIPSFELISPVWAKDRNYVYRRFKRTPFSPDSFTLIGCYVTDGVNIYMYSDYQSPDIISTEAKNFELIGRQFFNQYNPVCMGKDSQNVYAWNRKIDGADPSTYRFLNESWSVDKDSVFALNNLVPDLSPKGLVSAGKKWFAKNDISVFSTTGENPFYINLEADPETFRYEFGNDGEFYWQGLDKDYFYTRSGKKKAR